MLVLILILYPVNINVYICIYIYQSPFQNKFYGTFDTLCSFNSEVNPWNNIPILPGFSLNVLRDSEASISSSSWRWNITRSPALKVTQPGMLKKPSPNKQTQTQPIYNKTIHLYNNQRFSCTTHVSPLSSSVVNSCFPRQLNSRLIYW